MVYRKLISDLIVAIGIIAVTMAIAVSVADCALLDACEDDGTIEEYDCIWIHRWKGQPQERVCKWRCK